MLTKALSLPRIHCALQELNITTVPASALPRNPSEAPGRNIRTCREALRPGSRIRMTVEWMTALGNAPGPAFLPG
jgi:hypothetical protein